MTISPEVIEAAMSGVADLVGIAGGYRGVIEAGLETAAPLITEQAAAAERDRIAVAVSHLRQQAQRLAQLTGDDDLLSVGFHAQDEALAAVLSLLGDHDG